MEGYTPHVGALLSSMIMMRAWVVYQVKDLTVDQLDFQVDEQSNSIGAMLWHFAATEKYYQLNTFDRIPWGKWSNEVKQEWDLPMGLGEKGREEIKGNPIEFIYKNSRPFDLSPKKNLPNEMMTVYSNLNPFSSNNPPTIMLYGFMFPNTNPIITHR